MQPAFLDILSCPKSGQKLTWFPDTSFTNVKPHSGKLLSQDQRITYEVVNGVARFVQPDNYASNFGYQWNKFRTTQLDSNSNLTISGDRFWQSTRWDPSEMKGKWVLDAGCGMGRFAEIALKSGAQVVALDYSNAVDACYENLKHHKNLHVIQADIYNLPFAPDTFTYIYSLGVLQHTPDVSRSFKALYAALEKNGKICVDFYEKSWRSMLQPKYWLRPFTKRVHQEKLFKAVETIVPILLPISDLLNQIPIIGSKLKHIVPVANLSDEINLTKYKMREWSILDTFDWYSPTYDNPQSIRMLENLAKESKLRNAEITRPGHLVLSGQK